MMNLQAALPLVDQFCQMVIASGPPTQVIDRIGDVPYIERWMIGRKMQVPALSQAPAFLDETWGPSLVENIYVHRYGRSDFEDLHDHPWDNVSLIVRGYYVEDTPTGQFRRLPGDIVLRKAEDRHRIIEVEPETITLFGTLQKRREWGFWQDGQFIHWRDWRDAMKHQHPDQNINWVV